MPQSVADLFASWQGPFGRQHNIDLWWAVPHCVLWCLRWERNNRCFEGTERSILEIKSLLLLSSFAWCSIFTSFSCSNFLVLLDHYNFWSWCNPFHVHSQCTWGFGFMKYRYLSKKKKRKKRKKSLILEAKLLLQLWFWFSPFTQFVLKFDLCSPLRAIVGFDFCLLFGTILMFKENRSF